MIKKNKYLFAFILFVITTPLIQWSLDIINIPELKGSFVLSEKPESLNSHSWFSGEYQKKYNSYFNDHLGFRKFLVRFNNQYEFSLLKKINAYGLILGKNGYTFGGGYIINTYSGKDFLGKNKIDELLLKTKKIQNELKEKYNIDLIVVYAPSKEFLLPEYLPERYRNIKRTTTNIEYFLEESEKMGINYIDFNKFFFSLKDTCKYPIYYKQSEHWTYYTMCLAADSLVRYIEKLRNIDLPDVRISRLLESDTTGFVDYDQGEAMNLLFKLKQDNVVYPEFVFNSKGKIKPKVLSIADCYFQQIYQSPIADSCFNFNSDFWFYYKESQSKTRGSRDINQINKRKILLDQDVVILSHTNHTLNQFGYGFIDEFESIVDSVKNIKELNTEKEKEIQKIIKKIKNNREWFQNVKKQAKERGKSIDEMLRINAIYTLRNRKN